MSGTHAHEGFLSSNYMHTPSRLGLIQKKMAPQLSEDEVDDLLYLARVGDNDELSSLLRSIAEREKVSPAEILSSAKDEGQSTCLHMATGNGHVGE